MIQFPIALYCCFMKTSHFAWQQNELNYDCLLIVNCYLIVCSIVEAFLRFIDVFLFEWIASRRIKAKGH